MKKDKKERGIFPIMYWVDESPFMSHGEEGGGPIGNNPKKKVYDAVKTAILNGDINV